MFESDREKINPLVARCSPAPTPRYLKNVITMELVGSQCLVGNPGNKKKIKNLTNLSTFESYKKYRSVWNLEATSRQFVFPFHYFTHFNKWMYVVQKWDVEWFDFPFRINKK